jgi:hypothetical protein
LAPGVAWGATRGASNSPHKIKFSFELSCLQEEIIIAEWNTVYVGILHWRYGQISINTLLRGWAKNRSGVYKNEKQRLMLLTDELNIRTKTYVLKASERDTNDT